MSSYIKSDEFIEIAKQFHCTAKLMIKHIQDNLNSGYTASTTTVNNRIANYRRKGLLPLASGNSVSTGEVLKGSSTLYGPDGNIKSQWVKTDVSNAQFLESLKTTITELVTAIPALPTVSSPTTPVDCEDLATLYISNDVHLGLLTEAYETGTDWELGSGMSTLTSAYDHLFAASPASKVGIVVDLGDLTEADGFRNSTAKSGNPLDLSNRFPVVLRAAYQSLIYGINLALQKHELVYFYNVEGNHDNANAVAIREIIRQTYKDNPRVIVPETASAIQYHQHGETLIGFAHGDSLKMTKAGETMAVDCQDIFSSTSHRFFHFGHTHVDAVRDSAICRSESHRNLPPQNHWAQSMGYRRGCGTMKSISYDSKLGEVSRNIYNIS
jgi:hypothetical protein